MNINMATANGAPTPPTAPTPELAPAASDTSDNKRKREDDVQSEDATQSVISRSAQTQKDILEILEQYGIAGDSRLRWLTFYRHDLEPSFLKHAVEQKTSGTDRSPKKARLSDPSNNTSSISSKLSSGAYSTLQELRKDAEHVSESLLSVARAKASDREGQNGRLLVEDLKQIQRIQAFEQVVKDVVEQEAKYEAAHGDRAVHLKQESDVFVNGHTADKRSSVESGSGTVLTLFGNAPTPKQLFSSMQHAPSRRNERTIKAELPIEEMSLPTGLTATKIMSAPGDDGQSGPTFEEAFPPPYNLPALQPPKSHKRSSTRDETIKWEFKDPSATRSKKGGYTTQSVTVGDWLGYGGVDSKDEPSSPREKRKLRDRVLSSGESTQPPPSRASLEDALAKEEEALFRRAYSSFAPSRDNSKAIVPEEVKSMLWWHKIGHRRYEETFAIDPALLDERSQTLPEVFAPHEQEEEDFAKVAEEVEDMDEDMPTTEPSRDKTDVNEVLREISELLETLASYQRIRNASLHSSSSVSRTPISPAPALASRIGRPDSPSTDEISTYHALRRELAYLVLKLPPYAVAKLNGDQLADLGVSRLIPFQSRNVQGTMEEDQVARLAKYTAMATAAGIATLTRPGSGSQHYSSTNQRTPAIGQAANTRYGQSGQYTAGRTPIAQPPFNRAISNQSTYGTPSATASRPGYGQPNQYSRPGAPQSGYNQTNGQHYYQRQLPPQNTPGYGGYNQQYNQSTPQTQQRPSYPSSQPLAQYQQRSQSAAQNAVAYQTNSQTGQPPVRSPFDRTASPLKPAGYQPPLQPSPAPRVQQQFQPPAPAGSDRATPLSHPSTPVNGMPAQPRPVAPRTSSETPQPVQANGHA